MAFRNVSTDEIERKAAVKESGVFERLMRGTPKVPTPNPYPTINVEPVQAATPAIPIISILDPVIPVREPVTPVTPVKHTLQFSLPSLPKLNNFKVGIIPVVKVGVSLLLIWFGLTSTGSYYGPATGKFSGLLAQIFYQYQAGMLLAMVGLLVIYATLRDY